MAPTASKATQRAAKRTVALELPQLRTDQWGIVAHPAKIKVLAMGRRWGKSVVGQVIAVTTAHGGGRVAWCTPTYRNARPLWRLVKKALAPLAAAGLCTIREGERTVEFANGGFLALYSMDNPDSIRGENFHLVIVDEAAMISEEAWTDCIQPVLADNDGDCILISTPKGRNWFYREWMHALRHMREGGLRFAAFRANSRSNPSPNIQRAFDQARERSSERTFLQEWCAQFIEDGGLVFRGVGKVARARKKRPYVGRFAFGLDWGKSKDSTSITVIDIERRRIVDWDCFNQIGWSLQRGRVRAMFDKWQPELILAEENSIGGPNIEVLMQEGLPILGFNTNSATKGPLIESHVLSIERRDILIPEDEETQLEYEEFESETNHKTKRTYYGAPIGGHDDRVISGALADWASLHFYELLALLEQERERFLSLPEDEYRAKISDF